jgi:DNA-binding CsgD family transcriptional regulator
MMLTDREQQIFNMLRKPLSIPQICENLGLKRQTVKNYTLTIYKNFDVNSQIELIAKFGLINNQKGETMSTAKHSKISIFVPSTMEKDQPIPDHIFSRRVDIVSKKLSDLFGGSTAIDASGSYVAESGKLISEKVKIVFTFTENLQSDDRQILELFVSDLCQQWKQESVLLTIEPVYNVEFLT